MKIVIAIAFLLIIGSLGSALFFMMRDKGKTRNTARALGFRVGFSILLFLFILVSHQMGWIQATGVPIGPR
ncbi:MAG: twin transmembrane helix small protein [Burkholderiales bacterium]|nr:twin transmembrane helix small protein [Burkholderiales bacterium]